MSEAHRQRRAAVTGANGMIGRRVCELLDAEPGWAPTIRIARNIPGQEKNTNWRVAPDLASDAGWEHALTGADAVIHCAARAHVLKERLSVREIEQAFMDTNCAGAIRVADAAIAQEVSHFVFISSAGVVAEEAARTAALEHCVYSPVSTYARAKLAAEQALIKRFADSPCKLIIFRPPLVIARDAPGNVGSTGPCRAMAPRRSFLRHKEPEVDHQLRQPRLGDQ